jgi:nitric oxide dioxygenase
MALTYQQSKLVRDTIPALREHGEQITTTFYRNMLRDHPELNNYFNSVNQKNGRQPRALTSVQHQPHQRAHPQV